MITLFHFMFAAESAGERILVSICQSHG